MKALALVLLGVVVGLLVAYAASTRGGYVVSRATLDVVVHPVSVGPALPGDDLCRWYEYGRWYDYEGEFWKCSRTNVKRVRGAMD